MGTIWTPSGDQPLGASEPGASSAAAESDEERRELEAQMAEVQRQLVETPASVVVANHCIGLFQLAALHLNQQPPNLAQAQLAIDALGAIVEHLGLRLGEDEQPLRDALAQIRMAFVQIKAATAPEAEAEAEAAEPTAPREEQGLSADEDLGDDSVLIEGDEGDEEGPPTSS